MPLSRSIRWLAIVFSVLLYGQAAWSQSSPEVASLRISLREGDSRERLKALAALGQRGMAAWEAVGDIIATLEDADDDVAEAASGVLRGFGKKGIDALTGVAQNGNATLKQRALRTLRQFRLQTGNGGDNLVLQLLKDPDIDVKRAAIHLARQFEIIEAVPLLHDIVKTNRGNLRQSAIAALETFGAQAHNAEDTLIAILANPNEELHSRTASARALARISKNKDRVGNLMGKQLVDPSEDSSLRRVNLYIFQHDAAIGQLQVGKIGDLMRDLHSGPLPPDRLLLSQCVETLSHLTPLVDSLPTLVAISRDRKATTMKSHAIKAIGQLGPDARKELPLLIECVDPSDPAAREAIGAIIRILPEDESDRVLRSIQKKLDLSRRDAPKLYRTIESVLNRR